MARSSFFLFFLPFFFLRISSSSAAKSAAPSSSPSAQSFLRFSSMAAFFSSSLAFCAASNSALALRCSAMMVSVNLDRLLADEHGVDARRVEALLAVELHLDVAARAAGEHGRDHLKVGAEHAEAAVQELRVLLVPNVGAANLGRLGQEAVARDVVAKVVLLLLLARDALGQVALLGTRVGVNLERALVEHNLAVHLDELGPQRVELQLRGRHRHRRRVLLVDARQRRARRFGR
ncbi:hypothetical protein BN1723_015878, partial [Verticillium longisporum]